MLISNERISKNLISNKKAGYFEFNFENGNFEKVVGNGGNVGNLVISVLYGYSKRRHHVLDSHCYHKIRNFINITQITQLKTHIYELI
jgi:hypothetical protein